MLYTTSLVNINELVQLKPLLVEIEVIPPSGRSGEPNRLPGSSRPIESLFAVAYYKPTCDPYIFPRYRHENALLQHLTKKLSGILKPKMQVKHLKVSRGSGYIPLTHVGKVWIQESDAKVEIKLLVISHYGVAGHRGIEKTLSILKETYHWRAMSEDCSASI